MPQVCPSRLKLGKDLTCAPGLPFAPHLGKDISCALVFLGNPNEANPLFMSRMMEA